MLLKIFKNRTVSSSGTWGTKNENNYEILDFEFPEELKEYNKRIVYYLGNQKVWDAIIDNKAILTNAITTKGSVKAYIWCTKSDEAFETDVDFRTQIFVMNFFENDNADGIVPTPEQVDGFNTMLTAMNEKIEEINELETTIENAETQRQENESTRQENEQTRQEQEAERERRTDEAIGEIEDLTEAYNQNAEQKTEAFNNNATQKTDAFNQNAESKTNTFNTNATNKTNDFNSNASSKTNTFNENATSKTNTFNSNANDKTSAFNDNATQKTTNFDNNASEKTDEFNTNAQEKIDEYDEHIVEYQAQIDELQEEVKELSENMPWSTTEQATEISVDDAAKYSKNKLELFGNTYQLSLPSGYTHLEYIESTGTQYINLDYVIKSNTKLEIEYQTEKVAGNTLFGASNNNMNYYASGLGGRTANTGQDAPTNIRVSDNLSTEKTSLLWERAQVTYNGNVVAGNFGLDNSRLVLFKNRRFQNDLGKVKLYKFIAYDGNIIAANYIPCKNSNNEIGLYDLVSNTFYGNSGTGDLVAGPNYPQPIHVVTGNNSVGVQGKNLWDGLTEIGGGYSSTTGGKTTNNTDMRNVNPIKVEPNTQYIFSNDGNGIAWNVFEYSDTNFIKFSTVTSGNSFTTSNNTTYINISKAKGTYTKLQLEEGSTITSYVPYYHANYPINLGSIELCKIGDYQDYIYKENGNWYKYGAINKSVLDGTEANWSMSDNIIVCQAISNYSISNNIPFINYFKGTSNKDNGSTLLNNEACFNNNVNYSRFYIKTDKFENIADFKTWLSTNNLIVYCIARNVATTQITDETLISQLEAIYHHLALVKGTNHITITSSDLAPYVTLNYMQDLPAKLDNLDSRLSLLE